MTHNFKLYSYYVEWSALDRQFVGKVWEWPSLAANGDTSQEALDAIERVVANCIEDCEENFDTYPEPANCDGKCTSEYFEMVNPPIRVCSGCLKPIKRLIDASINISRGRVQAYPQPRKGK